jgi:sugar lactone lactonase YvrE
VRTRGEHSQIIRVKGRPSVLAAEVIHLGYVISAYPLSSAYPLCICWRPSGTYHWTMDAKPSLLLASLLAALALACGGSGGTEGCTDEPGAACVWAGTGEAGFNGDGLSGPATRLYWPVDVSFAPDGTPWLVDWNNHKVREMLPDGAVQTAVSLFHPTDVEFGPEGLMYIADWHNYRLGSLDLETGVYRVIGGDQAGFGGDGGPLDKALFNLPSSIVFGPDGTLYVLDQLNQRIRMVAPDGARTVTTLAGTGVAGFSGDGGSPSLAQLSFQPGDDSAPSGALAIGPDGALYVADALNFRIRRIDLESGVIDTVAGSGKEGFAGDGGPALQAELGEVKDIEFGPDGRLYVADTNNDCVRAVDLSTGVIDLIWDGRDVGPGLDGDARLLDRPFGIAFDPQGRLYIADTDHHRIVRVTLPAPVS